MYFSKQELTEWVKSGRKKTIAELNAEADTYLKSKKENKMKSVVVNQFENGQFNTLVQSGTNKNRLPKRVAGNGMKIVNKQTLLDFSKKKMITQSLIPKLVDVARDKGAFKRKQMYWNAYHCCNTVYSEAGSLFVDENKYCKTRICAICSGIRKQN